MAKDLNGGIPLRVSNSRIDVPTVGVRSSAGNYVVATDGRSQREGPYLLIVTNRKRRDDRFQECSKQLLSCTIIGPAKNALRPPLTAWENALAIRTGSRARDTAVFNSTPSKPHSMT